MTGPCPDTWVITILPELGADLESRCVYDLEIDLLVA
jgi:hypothetical protein